MDKRYQVFLSSTYADLSEERQKVIQALMEMDCIPAGMELFPAADEEQFQFIKKVIDDCDYYLLIIGGRYGSLSSDGISYTQKEYEYAISKGLKVIAFLHEKPQDIPTAKSDTHPDLQAKLHEFRDVVAKGRLVKFWTAADQLPGLVALSLSKTIKTYPAIGWLRADQTGDPKTELILREKIDELKKELDVSGKLQDTDTSDLCQGSDKFRIQYTFHDQGTPVVGSKQYTWDDIFRLVCPIMTSPTSDREIKDVLLSDIDTSKRGDYYSDFDIAWKFIGVIKTQALALGLAVISDSGQGVTLSPKGFRFLTLGLALRRKKGTSESQMEG